MQIAVNEIQIVIDAVQAKYPGNEWVKKCGPNNHDRTCYDPSIPHLVYHVYRSKERCENEENTSCASLDDCEDSDGSLARWIPIDKPVVTKSNAEPK